jgi:hypothetical protein
MNMSEIVICITRLETARLRAQAIAEACKCEYLLTKPFLDV